MAMTAEREGWTDERLDDLNAKVDRGIERVDADLRGLRTETRDGFAEIRAETRAGFAELRTEMDARFDRVDARFDRLEERINARIDKLGYTLIFFAVTLAAAVVSSNAL